MNASALSDERKVQSVPVKQLLLDPRNPRLPGYRVEDEMGVMEEEHLNYMIEQGNVIELMNSIGESGYYEAEPLLIVPVKEGQAGYVSGKKRYYVVEGNRRLSAIRLLLRPEIATKRRESIRLASEEAKHKPTSVPAIIYDERADLLTYLGFRHITGTKPWGSLEKAVYLAQVRQHQPSITFPELARMIGSRSDYVAKLLTAHAIYKVIEREDFFRIDGLDAKDIKFSFITTALGYSGLLNFLGLEDRDPELPNLKVDNLNELTGWMFKENSEGETRLGESRRLKDLAKVVANDEALEAFRAGRPLESALLLTGAPLEVYRESIDEARARLEDARSYLHVAKGLTDSDREGITEIDVVGKCITRPQAGQRPSDRSAIAAPHQSSRSPVSN